MALSPTISVLGRQIRVFSSLTANCIGILTKYIIYHYTEKDKDPIIINEILIGLSGVIILMPTLTLVISVTEISSRNIVSGATRLLSGFFYLLQIGFGLQVANVLQVALSLPSAPVTDTRTKFAPWVYALVLPACTVTFIILLKAPKYPASFFFIMLASYVAYFAFYLTNTYLGRELAAFLGCFCLNIIANIYNRFVSHPSYIVVVCGIILLLPGSFGIKGFYSLMTLSPAESVIFLFRMIMSLIALSSALTVSNYMLPSKQRLNL